VWLFSEEHRPERHAATFATLQALNLKVGRAWAIKEALRTLWTYRQPAAVKRFFTRWYGWAVRSRLDPVKAVAATLKRHVAGVLRFVEHPITTGVAEGLNSKIMSIKRKAGGFRNQQTSRRPFTFIAAALISTHAKAGRFTIFRVAQPQARRRFPDQPGPEIGPIACVSIITRGRLRRRETQLTCDRSAAPAPSQRTRQAPR